MIDYHEELVDTLNDILPTYYELNLTSGIATPCISYMQRNDYVVANGDTLGYSKVQYQIKVWGNKLSDLQGYSQEIDEALRAKGFTRISTGELWDRDSAMKQKILVSQVFPLLNFSLEIKKIKHLLIIMEKELLMI